MCAEYGEKLGRPHYHYLIFGYDFPDKEYSKKSLKGTTLYRSKLLNELWPFGKAWIGEVDFATCAYISNYVTKKITGEKAWEHYRRTDEAGNDYWLPPEFGLMSRNPGIGATWFEKYHNDVTVKDEVTLHGRIARPPRYYDKLLEKIDPAQLGLAKMNREIRAQGKEEDNTPARLLDKEIIAKARLATKERNYEK